MRSRKNSGVILPVGRAFDAYNDKVTKTFTITANEELMGSLEWFLAGVAYCGSVGHSCVVGMSVDGDGADKLSVKEPLPKVKDMKTYGSYPNQYEKAARR